MPTRQKIQSIVSELLRRHAVLAPPIPVAQIARTQGLDVVIRSIDGGTSGFIAKTGPSSGLIGVNSQHARPRQRFTIAHELGHHFLSSSEGLHVDQDEPILWFRDDTSAQGVDVHEIQANRFAAELLMPHRMLLADVEQLGQDRLADLGIRDLAEKYEVSPDAMKIRLQQLEILPK